MSAKAKTRQHIIEAAQKLFLQHGYSDMSVDDLARELGISKKTIYNHFSSKSELLMAGIEQFAQEYQTRADAILNDVDLTLRQKVAAYLRFIGISFANINQGFWTDIKRSEPEAWKKACEIRRDIPLKHFSQLMDEGVRVGYLRDDSSRHIAMLTYVAAIQQLTDLDFLSQFPGSITSALSDDLAARADQIVNLLLHGLLTPRFYNE
ncbi:TetR/AcrR family transcriptional regulator [Spirosoma pulveris]